MIPTPVVLLGSGGMLGRAFGVELDSRRIEYLAPKRPGFDLARPETIQDAIPRGAATVINCAAWTNVDGAEADEPGATAVNGTGVGSLAAHCREVGALLITYSTDYVFNGTATSPYRIGQPRQPLSAYGRSKAVGEELLERSGADYLNIRTSWLYAPWGNNFVRTIARLLREKPSIKVVDDQRGRPTSSEHLARATIALLEAGGEGTFHITDGGECTWFEFAREVGRVTGAPGKVEPCTSAEFPRPAKRPAYSVLDLSETERLIGPMPEWKHNLGRVASRLE